MQAASVVSGRTSRSIDARTTGEICDRAGDRPGAIRRQERRCVGHLGKRGQPFEEGPSLQEFPEALAFHLGEFRSHREGIAYPMRPETNDTDALRAKFPSKRAGQPLYRCASDAKAARERDSHPRR